MEHFGMFHVLSFGLREHTTYIFINVDGSLLRLTISISYCLLRLVDRAAVSKLLVVEPLRNLLVLLLVRLLLLLRRQLFLAPHFVVLELRIFLLLLLRTVKKLKM